MSIAIPDRLVPTYNAGVWFYNNIWRWVWPYIRLIVDFSIGVGGIILWLFVYTLITGGFKN